MKNKKPKHKGPTAFDVLMLDCGMSGIEARKVIDRLKRRGLIILSARHQIGMYESTNEKIKTIIMLMQFQSVQEAKRLQMVRLLSNQKDQTK